MSSKHRPFKTSVYWNGKKYTLTGTQALRHAAEMGQLHITTINGQYTSQILPGMPEIHYTYTDSHPFQVADRAKRAAFTRKMDGTCVMFSSLDLLDGNRGVFALTRGMMPIKGTKWRALETMLSEAISEEQQTQITKACLQQNATLVFELWGSQNRHTVHFDEPIGLSLHTMIRGKGTVIPWNTTKQMSRWYGISVVEELLSTEDVRENSLLRMGQELVMGMEQENQPDSGLYRHEGVILNAEAQGRGWQWKFKPASMEEYHRVARTNVCPVTVTHTLWKLVDEGVDLTLHALKDAMLRDYPAEAIWDQWDMIEHEYWAWMTREEQYFALIV
jgi:hypothetical protein